MTCPQSHRAKPALSGLSLPLSHREQLHSFQQVSRCWQLLPCKNVFFPGAWVSGEMRQWAAPLT